jgi:transcriptional regulator GlxA family with amidase domain
MEYTAHNVIFWRVCVIIVVFSILSHKQRGHAVEQWLRQCATNRKVAGSIADGVI